MKTELQTKYKMMLYCVNILTCNSMHTGGYICQYSNSFIFLIFSETCRYNLPCKYLNIGYKRLEWEYFILDFYIL